MPKIPPFILIILDGWGLAPAGPGNAISLAQTPTMDFLLKTYPCGQLIAHGKKVGLPNDQEGNSEAGHINLGGGRIVDQDAVIINKSINEGTFFKNPAFREVEFHIKKNKSSLHLIGMLSNGQSAHSDPRHLLALLTFCQIKNLNPVYLHLFTDGRDSPPFSALSLIKKLSQALNKNIKIVTIIGRFYAMDRNKIWERTQKAYNALVLGEGERGEDSLKAIKQAYDKSYSDEFIPPTIITPNKGRINDNDAILFFNLRSDRVRQLTKTFVQTNFESKNPGTFKRKKILKNILFVAMTDFGPDLDNILTAYPSVDLNNTLPMVLKEKRQLYIAESEKYAHVTYFFNGGYADPVAGEKRSLIPSPKVDSYARSPEMSAGRITENVLDYLRYNRFDFITVNFANPDMIGHTGDIKAGIKAIEVVDQCLKKIIKIILSKNGYAIITADHGNIEEMLDPKTGEIDTEHSTNPVPFIIVSPFTENYKLKNGILADVAPTVLKLMGIQKPAEMTGVALI